MKSTIVFPPLMAAIMLAAQPVAAQPVEPTAADAAPAVAKTFSQQTLDQLLAPIALYPDPLLAQILMASTYPLEVVQAARWVKANPKVSGQALEEAMAGQAWDPAVKAMTAVPQVLEQMNENLDWTQKLGDAFLAQKQEVMATVQSLRAKAHAEGNLKSSAQQTVKTETQGSQTVYIVEPAKTEVVYVPTYNPTVVYGSWWYPAPPYTMYPPAYVYPPGVAFATGIIVGAAIWGNCRWGWGNNDVDIDINRYNNFNRTNVSNRNWNHNVDHRRGVAYSDKRVAQQYNRGTRPQNTQGRNDFRGYGDTGARPGTSDRSNRGMGAGDRPAAGTREAGGRDGPDGRSQRPSSAPTANRARDTGSGFSGAGGGGFREASNRGSASRAQMGGFGGGGARGGGGRGGGGRR